MGITKFLAALFFCLILVAVLCLIFQDKVILQAKKLPLDYRFRFDGVYEELFFSHPKEEVRIHTLYFPHQHETGIRQGFVFYLHGNTRHLQYHAQCHNHFTSRGYDVLMMDYRTFGKSHYDGSMSQSIIHDDVQWIFESAQQKFGLNSNEIVVYGRSLGTGIATFLAKNNAVKALILEAPYYNIADVPRTYIPFLPFDKMLKYSFDTDQWLPAVSCPTYIFHGTNDYTVPYTSGLKLKDKMANAKYFYTIEGAGHNDLVTYELYQETLSEILHWYRFAD